MMNEEEKSVCKHCHPTGHISSNCFAIIDYPEWWGIVHVGGLCKAEDVGGPNVTAGGRGRNATYVNAVNVPQVASQTQANHVITDKDRDGVHALSDTQWRTLVTILNAGAGTSSSVEKLSGKSSLSSWILDTGASHHLTGNFSLLTNV